MSIELVEREISRFLDSSDPEVLCLRGRWGVGKTFSWNMFLRQAKSEGKIALPTYSYVSLFGRNHLAELRYAIFENSILKENIGFEPSLESLKSNTNAIAEQFGRKTFRWLGSLPIGRDYIAAFQSASYLWVRQKIVCFDDIERKGRDLSIKDFVGLCSELKEQRACKVALILNEDALDATDKVEFNRFHEKVIDVALEFAPDANDCVRIALEGKTHVHDQIRTAIVKLGISNIRIIKRIERLVVRVQPLLVNFDSGVLHQAIASIALFAWSLYSRDIAPSIEYLRSKRGRGLFGLTNADDLSAEEKEWGRLLDDYGFASADEFDLVLLDGIQRGFFNESDLRLKATELNERMKVAQSEAALRASWRLYHDSFENNETEVVTRILSAFREHVTLVTQANLSGMVSLLKALGHAHEASDAIEFYMAQRNEDADFFNLAEIPFADEITDTDVRSALDKKFLSFEDSRIPLDVLLKIAERNGWSRKDLMLLSHLDIEDYYTLFKSQNGPDLRSIVEACLRFGATENADAEMRAICEKAKQALIRIGRESRINRVRVERKYKVDVGE